MTTDTPVNGAPGVAAGPGVPAAFFDLDKILRSSVTLLMLGKGLDRGDRTENLVSLAGARATAPMRRRAGLTGPPSPDTPIRDLLAGRSTDEVQRWARQIATREILPRVHPQVVELVSRARQGGLRAVLVTAAPDVLAQAVGATLDFDEVVATAMEVDDTGHYTGRSHGPVLSGPAKLDAVQALAARTGLNLTASRDYSDELGSRELLDAVGFPHVVNPDAQTRSQAQAQGWPIHEIRSVHWLWVTELPGLGTFGAAAAAFGAGVVVGGRRRGRRAAVRD